jgi:hypothetical protein
MMLREFGEAFRRAMLADWEKHGAFALERVRRDRPAEYLRLVAAFSPRSPAQENALAQLTDEQLEARIQSQEQELKDSAVLLVRGKVEAAESQPPGPVPPLLEAD